MDTNRLYQILEFNMNETETRAFHLALLWEELTKEYFPGENCGKLPTKGDPRKSHLFFHCHKLARESKGVILDDQFRWYMKAQLDILKSKGAIVNPACLVGMKAWKRWKVWMRRFNDISKVDTAKIEISENKIFAKLKKTKEFLLNQFKREPTPEDICNSFQSRAMIRWITLGKVCGYYVVLSPLIAKCLEGKDFENQFNFDLSLYKVRINDAVSNYFKKEFSYEFA